MDKKAKQILMKTFWSSSGWKDTRTILFSGEDFEYAKDKGLMFDPITIGHDECVLQMIELHKVITKEMAAKAFLHSLSTRKVYLRSALSSWALTHRMAAHPFESNVGKYTTNNNGSTYACFGECYVCDTYGVAVHEDYTNEDINVLNFERIKWGGVRLNHMLYCMLDLEQLLKEADIAVSEEDVDIFKNILAAITSCAPADAARQLEKRLNGILPSNKSERDFLMEIMAYAGILTAEEDRPGRGGKNDFCAIVNWRGVDGYSKQAVQDYFGQWL
ncbi:hypothetical protein LQV63_21460 [Paenibacillus profundus]|uniref:Uncharacterized protein n=1 Tax=Paenibacillus profundus TaxID=1173085 RepID=A0ABS8YJ86_9BACL|nr:hypothetical protein [Paenibacillus profundus]MCE5171851.1 hypothetical protein [Paenibacillus profundus]